MNLEERVLLALERHHLAGRPLLAAFSGGADSTALLLALRRVAGRVCSPLEAAHVNHRLRGPESDRDEEFVRRQCRDWQIPLHAIRVDTRSEAAAGENLEECARRLRYRFLFQVAAPVGAVVATAHNLNDQAETFLMKLFRGAGPPGLSGIHPVRANDVEIEGRSCRIMVVRPVLEVSRSEIEKYLDRCGQRFCEDSSNRDVARERNWIRHELIPLIEGRLNPGLAATLDRTAGVLREVTDYLETQGRQALRRCRLEAGTVQLKIPELERLPAILKKEVIRRALAESRGTLRGLTLTHITDVAGMIALESGKEIVLPDGLRVRREFDRLRFDAGPPVPPFHYELSIPGEVLVAELGKRVRAGPPSGESAAAVTIRLRQDRLTVRNRRAGDRYTVRPGSHSRKLKELFQKHRVPLSERDRRLILEAGGEIVWVEGFPLNPAYDCETAKGIGAVEIRVSPETLLAPGLLKEQEE